MQSLTPQELAEWLADTSRLAPLLLDVREPWEFELCHLPGSRHLPLRLLPERLNELPPAGDVVVICHHGVRSSQAGIFLERSGLGPIHNLSGGVDGWAAAIDFHMRRY